MEVGGSHLDHAIEECAEIQPDQMRQILREISPDKNWQQFEEENDTDFAYELPGLARFRVNLFMDNRGPEGSAPWSAPPFTRPAEKL